MAATIYIDGLPYDVSQDSAEVRSRLEAAIKNNEIDPGDGRGMGDKHKERLG